MSSVKLKYKGVVYYISIWTSGVKAYTGIIYDTEYKNPDYNWTCNEYGEMFKQLNKLCREYDGQDWLTSALLADHWKSRQVVIRAINEWRNIQLGKGLE